MTTKRVRRSVAAWALLLALVGAQATGSTVFAQEGETVTAEGGQTQTTQQDQGDGFPWGLLGLLGLGGLAGLNRRDNSTRTVETVDASRRR